MIKPATKSIVTTESKSVKGQQPATGYISLVKNPVKLKINIGKKKTSVVGVASAGTKVNKKPANTARTSTSMDAAASSRLNSARYPVP